MIYVTSDQHFGHKNIIKYANRPFDFSYEGMKLCSEHIINNYNELINDDDIVYHLGDICMAHQNTRAFVEYIIPRLNGKKHLIRGNHDDEPDEFYLKCGFESVQDFLIKDDKFLCHYPCFESKWMTKEEKKFMKIFKDSELKTIVHGHIHNKDSSDWDDVTRINASVDFEPNNFYPILL